MRRKFLATLTAVCMVIGMTGCGDDTARGGGANQTETRETESYSSSVTESNVVEESTEMDESIEESSYEESKVEDSVSEKEPAAQEPKEISGLIVMTTEAPLNALRCTVSSIDPENGNQNVISSFEYRNQKGSDYYYDWLMSPRFYGKYIFDESFTKMAVTKTFASNYETHAGWLLENGEFFDVIEAIGAASQSDFADPVYYRSLGFTDDGYFAFFKWEGKGLILTESDSNTYYTVPISNVTADTVQEERRVPYSIYTGNYEELQNYDLITDWIDSSHCLVTEKTVTNNSIGGTGYSGRSMILNIEDGSTTDYVPGDTRSTWNGYVSPDGAQIAFMSAPKSGEELPDIFITAISGGEPKRIPEHMSIMADYRASEMGFEKSFDGSPERSILIDWR